MGVRVSTGTGGGGAVEDLAGAAAELSANMGVSMEEATRALLGIANAFGYDYTPPGRWTRALMWMEAKLRLPRTDSARGLRNGFILGNLVAFVGVTVFALLYMVVT